MAETRNNISAGKRILFPVISIIMLLVLIEGLVSIYYYRQNGGERLASVEAIKALSSKLRGEENQFTFAPWVEYKHENSEPTGTSSTPFTYFAATPGDTIDIYLFGGTDMAGVASHLINLYKSNQLPGSSIRVYNHGSANYYSYQELILMSSLIQNGHRPDIIVCLDGINEFRYGMVSYQRQSYFSHVFRQYFDNGLRSKGKFVFHDTAHALSRTPDFMEHDKFCDKLIDYYMSNLKNFRTLADMIGAKAYFFCEPSPFYQSGEAGSSEVNVQDVRRRFDYIYPKIQAMKDSIPELGYLGNIGEEKDFNADGSYTPALSRKIAERIFAELRPDLVK